MRHLLSKIVAGGLSAGVILLWWPLVFPSDTVESWLIRGVLWTLCFELMLHSFAPLEEALWRSRAARRLAASLGTEPFPARGRARFVVAAVALTVPLTLLATAPSHPLSSKPVASATPVRHVTQVKRVVRVERRTVTVPRAAAAAPAPTPQSAGTTTGLGPDTRRPVARRVAPVARPRVVGRGSSRSGSGTGRRSGSSSPSSTTTATPTTGTPSTGTPVGSGERAATAPVAQPKRI